MSCLATTRRRGPAPRIRPDGCAALAGNWRRCSARLKVRIHRRPRGAVAKSRTQNSASNGGSPPRDTAWAMSEEDVEVVRAAYERWGEGDFRASADLFDRQIAFTMMRDAPDSEVYVGVEGVAKATRRLFETWADFTLEAEELIPVGDSVLVSVRQHGVARISGVPSDEHYFAVWSFRGRKVIRIEHFPERALALEAAGLQE